MGANTTVTGENILCRYLRVIYYQRHYITSNLKVDIFEKTLVHSVKMCINSAKIKSFSMKIMTCS